MSPVLVRFGDLFIPSYLAMFAVGACAFIWLGSVAGERNSVPLQHMAGFLVAVYAAGLVGARLLFVLEHHRLYPNAFQAGSSLFPGGFASHGGFILGTLAGMFSARRLNLPLARVADSTVMGLCALGVSIRLGCLLGGCCYGRPTELPWAVAFPPGSPATLRFGFGTHVHPAQLYEVGYLLVIALGLLWAEKEFRFHGEKFLWLVLAYSVARFLNEFLRGDSLLDFWGLTPAQWMSMAMIVIALGLMEYGRRVHEVPARH